MHIISSIRFSAFEQQSQIPSAQNKSHWKILKHSIEFHARPVTIHHSPTFQQHDRLYRIFAVVETRYAVSLRL